MPSHTAERGSPPRPYFDRFLRYRHQRLAAPTGLNCKSFAADQPAPYLGRNHPYPWSTGPSRWNNPCNSWGWPRWSRGAWCLSNRRHLRWPSTPRNKTRRSYCCSSSRSHLTSMLLNFPGLIWYKGNLRHCKMPRFRRCRCRRTSHPHSIGPGCSGTSRCRLRIQRGLRRCTSATAPCPTHRLLRGYHRCPRQHTVPSRPCSRRDLFFQGGPEHCHSNHSRRCSIPTRHSPRAGSTRCLTSPREAHLHRSCTPSPWTRPVSGTGGSNTRRIW